MLTKRTNILFDEDMWKLLVNKSKTQGLSIGKLIRNAVDEVYNDAEVLRMKKAHETILKIRKVSKGRIDYKALINEGRRF